MTGSGAQNIFVPMDAVATLSVPPMAVTDGSPDPVWVDLPCRTDWAYGRRPTLRLPLDAATAAAARRWTVLDRRRRTVWGPLSLAVGCAMLATLFVPGDEAELAAFRLVACLAILVSSLWTDHLIKRVTVAQHPEVVGRLGVYLPAVSTAAATEWARLNPGVHTVSTRPRWRRFPSRVYVWAAGSFAVAAVGLWWAAFRDADSGVPALFAFVLLVGAAIVSFFKALPLGFIRFDDERA